MASEVFLEYFECYADWDSTSGLMLLKEAPLPRDNLKIGAGGINQIWCDAKVRAAGIKRAQTLVEAAQNSVGLEAGEAARLEIWVLVNDCILKAEQLKRLDEYLEEKVREVANVEKMLAIKGVGMSTVIGFIAEVGDIGHFTDPKQIQKLAGLEIAKKSSGKKRGQPRISKRERKNYEGQYMNQPVHLCNGIQHFRMCSFITGTGRRIHLVECRPR
ncbi:transposase [Roseburia sp. 1XD42-69]|uniref:transposase n=1 Tax=Roseburia sp. 1XD42-69 TaxID=2320088 RepID=UPI000EA1B449|nr:IS110 family transposase [Roseburia sp. 1XD42-69]